MSRFVFSQPFLKIEAIHIFFWRRMSPASTAAGFLWQIFAFTGTISCFVSRAASRIWFNLLWKVVLAIPFSSHHALIVFPLARNSRYISVHACRRICLFVSLILLSSINSHQVPLCPGIPWDFFVLYGYCTTLDGICTDGGLVGGYNSNSFSQQIKMIIPPRIFPSAEFFCPYFAKTMQLSAVEN